MTCPSPETLESFLSDSSSLEAPSDLDRHLEDCASCQERLRELSTTTQLPADATRSAQGWTNELAGRLASRLRDVTAISPAAGMIGLPITLGDYELLAVIGRGVWESSIELVKIS